MDNDLISIIVPLYNASKTIEKCLESLMNQTYKNIEIIMIDDGSIDDSYNICLKYSKVDPRIKLFKQKNAGVSVARNKGLEVCLGSYIGFVDSDDFVDKNMYFELYENIKKNNCKLAICNYFFEDNNGGELRSYKNDPFIFKSELLPIYMMNLLCINGFLCNKLYSRDLIINSKFSLKLESEIKLIEDNLFNYNIYDLNHSFDCIYINDKLYHYVQNQGSACNHIYTMEKLQYFMVRNKQIDILNHNNVSSDHLKVDYVFNFIKDKYKIKHLNLEKNQSFYDLEKDYFKYLKQINTKDLSKKLKVKYYIAKYFPALIVIMVLLKKENI